MAKRRRFSSLSTPITLGAISVPLAVALLVGWTLLIVENLSERSEITLDVWLLVLGAISFIVIVTVLVVLSIFLGREILEVRKQDSFIDSVTHELKSPLASIRLGLETLGREGLPARKGDELRAMMLDDVERLTALIDDVLHATRIHATGSEIVNLSELDLAQILEDARRTVLRRRDLPADAIRVECPSLPITSDATSLALILRNLVDNAAKYSDPPVRVVARGESEQDRVRITITDLGIGIGKDDLRHVSQRFYRGNDASTRERKGTGLGLYVASSLVKNLGGTLTIQSEGPGRGTSVTMVLPRQGRNK